MITTFFRTLSAVLLLTLVVAGCSTAFTYRHLDWLIPWYVDGYVDLTRDQRHLLQDQLWPVLAWHEEEELGHYLDILDRLETELQKEVSAEQVRSWADEVIAAVERVEQNMLNVALEFSESLSDEQLAEFMESVWEEHREYEDEFLSRTDQEYVEENAENLEEFLERFTGRLTDRQEDTLLRAAGSLRRFDSVWLEDHEQWLNTLGPLLKREPGWEQAIRVAYANRTLQRSQEYTDLLEYNTEVVSTAFAEVLNSMNEKQRKHVFAEIEDLRSQVQRLLSKRKYSVAD
ncbi:MAG: DUF6279 family lipoprotein [Xanthomonadales bacterium]|nr:DUF6279 family lipoprotein [Xanthomonadales bacterium]MDH3923476.1 DUF6279 family lipoprotein [Xanthomonadales bacterium]MDH3939740.1 DUF6279 family lipoprotein [Xanthomonadales bacterium]MDH4002721.1 DUF6279 family lipoprotein [Xanthomonadales bacterium]